MVCLGECVQEAHVSCKAEADSYQATVRPGLAGCLDPRGMVARRGGSCPANSLAVHRIAQLQNIRLGSAAANPLSKSRNQRADEDG